MNMNKETAFGRFFVCAVTELTVAGIQLNEQVSLRVFVDALALLRNGAGY